MARCRFRDESKAASWQIVLRAVSAESRLGLGVRSGECHQGSAKEPRRSPPQGDVFENGPRDRHNEMHADRATEIIHAVGVAGYFTEQVWHRGDGTEWR